MVTKAAYAAAAEELARRDKRWARIIRAAGPPDLQRGRPAREHFGALCRSICFQQLAGAAASTIHGRFVALFDEVTPAAILDTHTDLLRGCGLSGAKTASIQDLATKVVEGTVELDRFNRLDDDTVIAELTTVRGIGRWTAEMFLMFQLSRTDVWPTGDLGVRNGFGIIHGMKTSPTPKVLEDLGDPYRPYRTVAAWYCWRAVDDEMLNPAKASKKPTPRQ